MNIIEKLFDGRTVSAVLNTNLNDAQGASLARSVRIADIDEASWMLVGGNTFRVGGRVEKELPRLEQKELRAAA